MAAALLEGHALQLKLDFEQLLPILKCIICRLILHANGCCPALRAPLAAQA